MTLGVDDLSAQSIGQFRDRILAWYDVFRRDLPWRGDPDPYHILVSEKAADWDVLLLGNGMSRAVWSKFDYKTLLHVASGPDMVHRLEPHEIDLFEHLGADGNFEQVMRDLSTAITVARAFSWRTDELDSTYDKIREALIEAVHHVHVPYARARAVLGRIAAELSTYSRVFTLSYDLLLYWSIMQGTNQFTDCFDHGNLATWMGTYSNRPTKMFYPHGALHLFDDGTGGVKKDDSSDGSNLLAGLATRIRGGKSFPVFVSEGLHEQKLARIKHNPYLNFAYDMLIGSQHDLVVFGTAFGPMDHHIVRAINKWDRRVAISIYPFSGIQVRQEKLRLASMLRHDRPLFFDARSHPLGGADMSVDPRS